MLGTRITIGIHVSTAAPAGDVPANAITLGGEPLTLGGETLTLEDP